MQWVAFKKKMEVIEDDPRSQTCEVRGEVPQRNAISNSLEGPKAVVKGISRRMAEEGLEASRGEGKTSRRGTQVPLRQTARAETQVRLRRSHFDDVEYQEEETDLSNILEEQTQHWSEVERTHGQIDEVKGCVKHKNQLSQLPAKNGAAKRKGGAKK